MGTEILAVPEEQLHHVIRVMRAGLAAEQVPDDVAEGLRTWCNEHEMLLLGNIFEPVTRALQRWQFMPRDERHLYEGLDHALTQDGISFERERSIVMEYGNKGRLDYFLPEAGLAIEVKVRGAPAAILLQLRRYATCDDVKAILLVTTLAKLTRVPDTLEGKPVRAMRIAGGFG